MPFDNLIAPIRVALFDRAQHLLVLVVDLGIVGSIFGVAYRGLREGEPRKPQAGILQSLMERRDEWITTRIANRQVESPVCLAHRVHVADFNRGGKGITG